MFLRSDAATASIHFAAVFVQLPFKDGYNLEGSACFFFLESPLQWVYRQYSDDCLTLSVVHTASQSCCQPWKQVVQHKQPQR